MATAYMFLVIVVFLGMGIAGLIINAIWEKYRYHPPVSPVYPPPAPETRLQDEPRYTADQFRQMYAEYAARQPRQLQAHRVVKFEDGYVDEQTGEIVYN